MSFCHISLLITGGALPWRWFAVVVAVVPTLFAIFCMFIKESPRYLYFTNNQLDAIQSLHWLRGDDVSDYFHQFFKSEIFKNVMKYYFWFNYWWLGWLLTRDQGIRRYFSTIFINRWSHLERNDHEAAIPNPSHLITCSHVLPTI